LELRDFLHILSKRIYVLVLLPLFAGFVAYIFCTIFLLPVYEANTTVYVISKSTDPQAGYSNNDLVVSQQLVKDYQEFIKSRIVIENVMQDMQLEGVSYENLSKRITVKRKNDTRILEIAVRDTNPYLARDIAEKVTITFKEKVVELMNIENVNILDTARVPDYPVSPDTSRSVLFSFFAGLLAAIGLILLIDYMDNTIKSPEDVAKYLKLSVLGNIPSFANGVKKTLDNEALDVRDEEHGRIDPEK